MAPDVDRRTVLLVDDDASMRRALERTIRLAGFDVASFASAESLLARGIRDCDACMVLDVDLPGMDGGSCKRRSDALGRLLPTVFITALTAADVREALTDVASVAVLHKPFDNGDLLDAIGQACR
jgi:FixJ family two-component response regulator